MSTQPESCHTFCPPFKFVTHSIQYRSSVNHILSLHPYPKKYIVKFELLEDGEGMESNVVLQKVLSRGNVQDDIILEPVECL